MQRSFRGEWSNRIDAKGRVSIPAAFRKVIELGDPGWREEDRQPSFVVVYGDPGQKFLECYTAEYAAEFEELIEAINSYEAREAATRIYITQSQVLDVDVTGRIVLPQMLRERIAAQEELVFAGSLRTFTVWTPENYRAGVEARDRNRVEGDPRTDPKAALDVARQKRRS